MLPRRSWAVGPSTIHNSTGASFHSCTTVTLIRANSAGAANGTCDPESAGLTLQFAKDCILVSEKISDETVAVTFIHGKAALDTWTKNARRQCLCECRNVSLICRCEVYQARKMGHNSVKRSDVIETELTKCALQDLDPAFFRGLMSGGRINGLNNFVNLRRNKGIYEKLVSTDLRCVDAKAVRTWQLKKI